MMAVGVASALLPSKARVKSRFFMAFQG